MSKTVDSRVVEMRFDNQQFESNVNTSMGTIAKLKQALKFDNVGKGFSNINTSVKSVNMNPLSSAVETVGLKFSALQVMAATALANITNSAVNAGKRIVSAFTIDPIKSGFQEYETQINAVQTILANTESKGTTLGDVNSALDELNTYADKTIYNFTEMTRNIGTFTAAGVDLETSVSAIKGIANLAAVSGSTSQQASTAMYQLSQALASGTVKLQDWNSVVNAGMGGELFQNALKRTARNMGIAVDGMIAKAGSFRESLSKNGWLTTEVLTETLAQIAGAYTETDLIAKGYTESQTKEILKLANTAVNAATKVKTFTQLIDTTKEALQSGWTQSWEYIIGDFNQAKSFWTEVSDMVGDTIGKSADRRNAFIKEAMTSNWDRLIEKVNEAGVETSNFEQRVKDAAKELGYTNVDKLVESYGSLEAAIKKGGISSLVLERALTRVEAKVVPLNNITRELKKGDTGYDVKFVQASLKALGYDLGKVGDDLNGLGGKFDSVTENAIKNFQELNGLEVTGIVDDKTLKALDEAGLKTGKLSDEYKDLIENIREKGGRDLLHESLGNIINFALTLKDTIGQAFREIFDFKPEGLFNAIKSFNDFTESLKMSEDTIDEVKRSFEGLFAIIDIIGTLSGSVVKYAFKGLSSVLDGLNLDFLGFTAILGDNIVALRDWLDEHDIVGKVVEKIGSGIGSAISFIRTWIEKIKEIPVVSKALSAIGDAMSGSFGKLKEFFGEGGGIISDFISKLTSLQGFSLEGIVGTIKDFVLKIKDLFINADFGFGSIKTAFENFKSVVEQHIPQLAQAFDWIIEKGKGLCEFLKGALPYAIGIAIAAMAALALMKIADVVQTLTAPFVFLQEVSDSLGSIAKSIKIRAIGEAIKSVILAVVMLGAVIALLAQMDQGAVWSSLGVIVALIGGLGLLGYAMSKLSTGAINKIGKGAGLLAALAGSVLLAAISLKVMDGVDPLRALANAGILVGVVGALAAISTLLGSNSKISAKGAKSLIAIVGAMMLLVLVLKMLSKLSLEEILTALPGLAMIIGAIAALMAVTQLAGTNAAKAGGSLLMIAAALTLFVLVLKLLSKLKPEEALSAIPGLLMILTSMTVLMLITNLAGKNALKAGGSLLAISAAMILMAVAIKALSLINGDDLKNGLKAMAGITAIFGALMALSSLAGKNAAKVGVMLLALSASLLILVGCVAILKNMKADRLREAVGIIAILEALFGGLIVASHFAADSIGPLFALTAVVAALVGLVSILYGLAKNQNRLKEATLALGVIMGALALLVASLQFLRHIKVGNVMPVLASLLAVISGLAVILGIMSALKINANLETVGSLAILLLSLAGACAILSLTGPAANGALVAMYALTGVVFGLAAVLAYINKMEITANLETVASLSVLLLALSGACVILSGVGAVGKPALIGVGVLSALILAIIGIFELIGALESWKPEILESAITGLGKIGTAIGTFFGSVVNSFGDAATKSLPEIGTRLSSFMRNIQPFLTNAQNISKDTIEKISLLSAAIKALTGAEFLAGIASLVNKGDSFQNVASSLVSLGEGVSGFAEKMNGVNKSDLIVGTEATKALAGLMAVIPSEGGFIEWIRGKKDLSTFADGLKQFGEALSAFAKASSELTDDDVANMERATKAGKALADLANAIPSTGGVIQKIVGYKDLDGFSEGIETFGLAMVAYAKSISGLTEEDTTRMKWMANAGTALKDLLVALPESGGWKQKILGDQDLAKFGTQIVAYGGYLMSYVNSIKDFNEDDAEKIKQTATASKELSSLLDSLPPSGGWQQKILGDKDLADFGSSLATFIIGIRNFLIQARQIEDDDLTAIPRIGDVIDAVQTVVEKIPTSGGWGDAIFGSKDSGTFGDGLISVAKGIKDFIAVAKTIGEDTPALIAGTSGSIEELVSIANSITDNVDASTLMSAVTQLSELGTLIVGLASQDYSGLTSLSDALGSFGFDTLKSFTDAFTTGGTDAVTAVNTFLDTIKTAFEAGEPNFEVAGGNLSSKVKDGIESNSESVKTAAQQLGIGAAASLSNASSDFKSAGAACASGFAAGISENMQEAINAAASMAAEALAAAKAALDVNSPSKEFRKLGLYSDDGYVLGIKRNLNKVYDAGYKIGEISKNALEDSLDINSPSKELRKDGRYSALGFAKGLEDFYNKVIASSTRLSDGVKNIIKAAIDKITELVNDNIDAQPTIRPVMDLSEIQNGSKTLSTILDKMGYQKETVLKANTINSDMNKRKNPIIDLMTELKKMNQENRTKSGDTYQINGITYDDGSNVSDAIKTLVRAAKIERRA